MKEKGVEDQGKKKRSAKKTGAKEDKLLHQLVMSAFGALALLVITFFDKKLRASGSKENGKGG